MAEVRPEHFPVQCPMCHGINPSYGSTIGTEYWDKSNMVTAGPSVAPLLMLI